MREILRSFTFDAELRPNAGLAEMQQALGAFRRPPRTSRHRPALLRRILRTNFHRYLPDSGRFCRWNRRGPPGAGHLVRQLQSRFAAQNKGLNVLALSGCRDYSGTSWRGTALQPSGRNVAVILAMEPPPASTGNHAPANGVFVLAMRRPLGASTTISSVFSERCEFLGTSVPKPGTGHKLPGLDAEWNCG